MTPSRGPALLLAMILAGCGGGRLRVRTAAHGSFVAVVAAAHEGEQATRRADAAMVVLFSEADVTGFDLQTGERQFRRPIRAFGEPATDGSLVVVPVHGHRLVALDPHMGAITWEVPLFGQALTGVAVGANRVVVAGIDRRRGARSYVAALSREDGQRRWLRRADDRLGVPAVVGPFAFIPLRDKVLALSLVRGHEVARIRSPAARAIERIERNGEHLLAADQSSFFDLRAGPDDPHRFVGLHGAAFRAVEGLEPGIGDRDGVIWRLIDEASSGAPREAVFLARRVVMAVRFDGSGRPVQPRWIQIRHDQIEYVALAADRRGVMVVDEYGEVSLLDPATGALRLRHATDITTIGAVRVGGRLDLPAPAATRAPLHEDLVATLVGVIDDPDPRLLPAQLLALDLLWRDTQPKVRELVLDVHVGLARHDDSPQTRALRNHAGDLRTEPWGRANAASLARLAAIFRAPGAASGTTFADAVSEVVGAGSPALVDRLVELLSDPAISDADLTAVTVALRDLAADRAVAGVAAFVVRYHADAEVALASKALLYGLEFLMEKAWPEASVRVDPRASVAARHAIATIRNDRFTVPTLAAFVAANAPRGARQPTGSPARSTEPPNETAPPLTGG